MIEKSKLCPWCGGEPSRDVDHRRPAATRFGTGCTNPACPVQPMALAETQDAADEAWEARRPS